MRAELLVELAAQFVLQRRAIVAGEIQQKAKVKASFEYERGK